MKLSRKDDDIEEDLQEDLDSPQTEEDYLPPDDITPMDNYDDGFFGGDSLSTMEKHNDLLKQLTDFAPFLKDKINGWLGMIWNEDAGKYVRDSDIKPIMNRKCAKWCADYLKTYARQNNIITDIGQSEYNNMISDVIEVLWYNLGTRSEEFELRNNGDILRICVELEHSAELVLMGAGDGKYNRLLSTVTNRHESINMQPGMQQMGMPMMSNMYSPEQGMQKRPGMFGKIKKMLIGG